MDEEDIHLCLKCQTQICGLDNYVLHRRSGCGTNSLCGSSDTTSPQKAHKPPSLPMSPSTTFKSPTSSSPIISLASLHTVTITTGRLAHSNRENALQRNDPPNRENGLTNGSQSLVNVINGIVDRRNSNLENTLDSGLSDSTAQQNLENPLVDHESHLENALDAPIIDDANETLDEFFQSLELQRHSGDKSSGERHGEILDFINSSGVVGEKDTLPISSLLNMLDFSSDDNALFGSDDESPTRQIGGKIRQSTRGSNQISGKWKPGQMENYRTGGKSRRVENNPRNKVDGTESSVNRNRRTSKSRGKRMSHFAVSDSDSDVAMHVKRKRVKRKFSRRKKTQKKVDVDSRTLDGKTDTIADKSLTSKTSPAVDKSSQIDTQISPKPGILLHVSNSGSDTEGMDSMETLPVQIQKPRKTLITQKSRPKWRGKLGSVKISPNLEVEDEEYQIEIAEEVVDSKEGILPKDMFHCKVCQRSFKNKYQAARHFISAYHQRLSLNHPDRINMFEAYHSYLLYFSQFQCRICRFYCNTSDDLSHHLVSVDHITNTTQLLGTLMCAGCKFSTNNNDDLVEHFATDTHIYNHHKSKAVIVKEQRYNIKCKFCGLTQHSLVHMKRHVFKKHRPKQHAESKVAVNPTENTTDHKCRECDFTSPVMKEYMRHFTENHGKYPFKCEPCGDVFPKLEALRRHYECLTHLRMDKSIAVNFVNNSTKSSEYLYLCGFCDEKFGNEKLLKIHVRKTHEDENNIIKHECETCGKRYDDEKMLILHKFSHTHAMLESDLPRFYNGNDETSIKYRDYLNSIESCKTKDVVTCPEPDCNKRLFKMSIAAHLRGHTGEKVFKCPLCKSAFIHTKSLQDHIMVHLDVRQMCHVCNKQFSRRYFKNHMRTHTTITICDICSKTFRSASALIAHQRFIHSEKTFVCDFPECGYKFAKIQQLESHRRVHTNERPFACEFCDYRSKDKHRVKKHFKAKHQQQTVKSYPCEHCDYRAKTRTHLIRHVRIHTGSRPYHCPYCNYQCQTHDNLRKHVLNTAKHRGKSIYLCKFCNHGTNTVNEFRFHLSKEHSCDVDVDSSLIISQYTGVYVKKYDIQQPAEGMRIIPVRETNRSDKHPGEDLRCPMCTYHCRNRETMNRHLREYNKKHPNQAILLCELCGYRGLDIHDITYHRENVHRDENSRLSPTVDALSNCQGIHAYDTSVNRPNLPIFTPPHSDADSPIKLQVYSPQVGGEDPTQYPINLPIFNPSVSSIEVDNQINVTTFTPVSDINRQNHPIDPKLDRQVSNLVNSVVDSPVCSQISHHNTQIHTTLGHTETNRQIVHTSSQNTSPITTQFTPEITDEKFPNVQEIYKRLQASAFEQTSIKPDNDNQTPDYFPYKVTTIPNSSQTGNVSEENFAVKFIRHSDNFNDNQTTPENDVLLTDYNNASKFTNTADTFCELRTKSENELSDYNASKYSDNSDSFCQPYQNSDGDIIVSRSEEPKPEHVMLIQDMFNI